MLQLVCLVGLVLIYHYFKCGIQLLSLNSNTYNKISEVRLPAGDRISSSEGGNYYHVSLSLNNNSQIEFQSGDVIGYYHPSDPQQIIWSILTNGYASYSNTTTSPLTSIDTNYVDQLWTNHQPLIAVMFGKNNVEQFSKLACLVSIATPLGYSE